MTRTPCTAAVGLIVIVSAAVWAAEPAHHEHRYAFESFRAQMEDPARAQWQKPDEVVQKLHLQPGERVADIGAGTGYFSVLLARAVGQKGRVDAVDIDERAVRFMRDRFRREKLSQVKVVHATPTDPKLTSPVDLIFICDTWHHIDNRVAYLKRLRRHLSKSGRLIIVDFKPDADPSIGPPKEMRLSVEQVTGELRQGGFHVAPEPDFLPLQYVLSATLALR